MSRVLPRIVTLADGALVSAVQNWIMSRWPPSAAPSMSCRRLPWISVLVTCAKRRPSKSMLWTSLLSTRRLSVVRKVAP